MTITNRSERHAEQSDESSDERLVDAVRAGDTAAYATLWERHAGAGRRAARAITTAFDPDDVVSESFAAVLSAIQRGGGPADAFRPYLFATIRNVVAMWGRKGRPLALDTIPEDVLADGVGDPFETMSERSTIAHVFKSLPARHRTLLWYLEVEGMKPREIGPLMGLTPNAVSALSYRAREGFRQAWLEAHIAEPGRPEDCRWFCERVVIQGKRPLARADTARFNAHLRACRGCQIVAADVENVSRRLRAIVLPLILGGTAATAYLADAGGEAASAATWVMSDPGGASGIPVVHHAVNEGATVLDGSAASVADPAKHVGHGFALAAALTTVAVAAAGAVLITMTSAFSALPPVAAPAPTTLAQAETAPSPAPIERSPTKETPAAPSPDPSSMSTPQDHRLTAPALRDTAPAPSSSPGPTAPGAGPSSKPSPRPTERPSPSVLRWTHVPVPGAAVPDALTGVGIPGAAVSVRDEDGVVLLETTVVDDGTFVADVSGALLHQGMSIHAIQTDPATGSVQHAPVVGPLTFAVPTLTWGGRTGESEGEDLSDDESTECGGIRVSLTGEPGAWVAIAVDGHDVPYIQLGRGAREILGSVTDRLMLQVTVRYVDPATGRAGLSVAHDVLFPVSAPADVTGSAVSAPADQVGDDGGGCSAGTAPAP